MAGMVTFTFENAVLDGNHIGAGGSTFVWSESDRVVLAIGSSLDSITISSGSIEFSPASEVSINGTISIALQPAEGYDPQLTFPSFAGTILVSWPSTTGTQSAKASWAGLQLTDFAG